MNQSAIPRSAAIPLPALLLGAGGLIPFAGIATDIARYPDPNLSYFLGWMVQYGASLGV